MTGFESRTSGVGSYTQHNNYVKHVCVLVSSVRLELVTASVSLHQKMVKRVILPIWKVSDGTFCH